MSKTYLVVRHDCYSSQVEVTVEDEAPVTVIEALADKELLNQAEHVPVTYKPRYVLELIKER